jgi:hypothetical protein
VAAVLLGLVVLGMFALTVVFDALVHTLGTGGPVVESLSIGAAAIPATCVGVLLAARRPRNPIGWLLFAILIVGGSPTAEYDILDYRMHHGTLPLGGLSVVIQECWPLFLAFVAILWVFPDGKLPAGRWRRPSVILLVVGLVIAVTASLSGVVAVAGHGVHITAEGDLANPPKGFSYRSTRRPSCCRWPPGWPGSSSRSRRTATRTASAGSSSSGCIAGPSSPWSRSSSACS